MSVTANLTDEAKALRRRLYDQGMSDVAIGKRLGKSTPAIHQWRQRNGLPPHTVCRNMTPQQRSARMLLYQLDYSDARIAREQRVHTSSVQEWRVSYGLPAINIAKMVRSHDKHDGALGRIRRAIGRGLPRDIADDAVADLFLAVLDGTISLSAIEASARKFGNRALGAYASKFGPRSLDEDIGDGDGFRMLDLLKDHSSSDWLEEMGATVW